MLLDKLNFIETTKDIDRGQFRNSTLVFWDEAKNRGLEIINFKLHGRHTLNFAVTIKGKKSYFEYTPINLLNANYDFNDPMLYDNKSALKELLSRHHFPHAEGRSFTSNVKAHEYGMKLGFPLVVKPATSSLSRHVFCNIKTAGELQEAIKLVKQINCQVLIERYIPGDVHRVLILGNDVIACAKRLPGSIIGNGEDTVEKLITVKNKHPLRGDPSQRNFTLHKVEINSHLLKCLSSQDVTLKTKLKKGQVVFLSKKMTSGSGADIIDVTLQMHPENINLFRRVHKVLNIPLSGLDVICKDISIHWQEQPFAIIENNSLPFIDMHHFPSSGESVNVSSKVWDFVLKLL